MTFFQYTSRMMNYQRFMRTVFVCLFLWLYVGLTAGQSPTRTSTRFSPALRRLLSLLVTDVSTRSDIITLLRLLNRNSASSSQRHLLNIKPIDQIIEEAEDPATSLPVEPSYIQSENAFRMEGDIMMPVDQFTELQQNITFELFEEALAMMLRTAGQNTAMQTLTNAIRAGTQPGRRKRSARRGSDLLWPNAVMPIRIANSDFSADDIMAIERAMNQISQRTCVCFRTIDNNLANSGIPHVRIVDGSGCSSYVGMRSRGEQNSQDLTLNTGCRNFRTATHELLHALGLFHEQSRPDRDSYVKINVENVRSGRQHNFNRFSSQTVDSRGVPYDYFSIMHYSNRAFSEDGSYTIEPVPARNRERFLNVIGRATAMSARDVEVLRLMYNCPPTLPPRPTCPDYPYRLSTPRNFDLHLF